LNNYAAKALWNRVIWKNAPIDAELLNAIYLDSGYFGFFFPGFGFTNLMIGLS